MAKYLNSSCVTVLRTWLYIYIYFTLRLITCNNNLPHLLPIHLNQVKITNIFNNNGLKLRLNYEVLTVVTSYFFFQLQYYMYLVLFILYSSRSTLPGLMCLCPDSPSFSPRLPRRRDLMPRSWWSTLTREAGTSKWRKSRSNQSYFLYQNKKNPYKAIIRFCCLLVWR